MFTVKITGDDPEKSKKNKLFTKSYNVPALNQDEAYAWGVKQANEFKLTGHIIEVKQTVEA